MVDINHIEKYYLKPGYIFFSRKPVEITTILGTCVSVCLYDRVSHTGGMNHYLLPNTPDGIYSTKYGDVSMHKLISMFLSSGSNSGDLEARLYGGAAHEGSINAAEIAHMNINTARCILKEYNIRFAEISIGGFQGRKIVFNTSLNIVSSSLIKYSKEFSELNKTRSSIYTRRADEKNQSVGNRRLCYCS